MNESSTKMNESSTKRRSVYVVLCNKNPIVYCAFTSYKKALKYYRFLIDHRKEVAKNHSKSFRFSHEDVIFDIDKKGVFPQTMISSCILSDYEELNGCYVKIDKIPLK